MCASRPKVLIDFESERHQDMFGSYRKRGTLLSLSNTNQDPHPHSFYNTGTGIAFLGKCRCRCRT